MRLRLYELISTETWWVVSYDELGVLSIIRDEMECRDHTDEEIDFMLNDFEVNELTKCEAEAIGVTSEFDGEIRSLWQSFVSNRREGVIGTSLDQDPLDLENVDELNFDVDEY